MSTQTALQQGLSLVEETLRELLSSDVELLSVAAQRILRAGGKRIRPQLALLAFEVVGGTDQTLIVPAAAAVELVHTASLIHDDINDQSNSRRGQPTVNLQWGDGLALLVGDFVFVRLLKVLALSDGRVTGILARACSALVEGETLQMLAAGDIALTEEQYLTMIGRKTAALFAASVELGGTLGGGAEQQIQALKEYGYQFGLAYQIQDDSRDLVGKADVLGQPVDNDLMQGKVDLAAIWAMRRSPQVVEAVRSRDARAVRALLREIGATDYARQRAAEYVAQAKAALLALPPTPAREQLAALADLVITGEQ